MTAMTTTLTATTGRLVAALGALVMIVSAENAWSQETLKVAVPQRGAWDAGLADLGQRGGIFKKHGLNLEILYTQAGPESIQALIGGSIDIATASGVSAAFGTYAKGAPIAAGAAVIDSVRRPASIPQTLRVPENPLGIGHLVFMRLGECRRSANGKTTQVQ